MMVTGEILDVIAEKVSHIGGVRALYGLTDAAHAVCKQKLSQDKVDQEINRWTARGNWKQRSPKLLQPCTFDLPRVGGTGAKLPKRRAIDLHGVEELVRHFDSENIDSFRQNYEFVEREEAGSKRSRAAGAQRCDLAAHHLSVSHKSLHRAYQAQCVCVCVRERERELKSVCPVSGQASLWLKE